MQFGLTGSLYLAAAGAITAFCFWRPNFPKALAARIGIGSEQALRSFLLVYWIAVPVVIYRFLYLAVTSSQ